MIYLSDPNIPFYKDDRVQFPETTLHQKSGDCDDLVVLLASLFESLGIHTAFIDVQDPEKEMAHVYFMFDTGVSPDMGHLISANEKKYIIYKRNTGKNSCWVPIKSTLINRGFDKAWHFGAMQYLKEAKIRDGLMKGWVQIVPVQ